MRESVAEIERVLTTLHKELQYDQGFLNGLLTHKNETIIWLRERQTIEVGELQRMYDNMIDTLMKEIEYVEKHMATYEKGTPEDGA
jgi:hypothetical protein